MVFQQGKTLYAVVTINGDDGRVEFRDEPAIFASQEEAEVHMKFDTKQPVIIYELKPIWRSVRELKFEKVPKN